MRTVKSSDIKFTPPKTRNFDIEGTRSVWLRGISYGIFTLLLLPIAIVIVTSFNPKSYLSFALEGVSLRWYIQLFSDSRWLESFQRSLIIAAQTSLCAIVLGTLAAMALVRYEFRGKDATTLLVMAPFLVPPLILAIGLVLFFNLIGLRGTSIGFVIGHTLLTTPLAFLLIRASLVGVKRSLEEAARGLGAKSFRTFWEVTLPLIRPGILAAALFTFVVSFNEFNISLFLSSYRSLTLPIRIWTSLHHEISPVVSAISSILVCLSAISLITAALLVGSETLGRRS